MSKIIVDIKMGESRLKVVEFDHPLNSKWRTDKLYDVVVDDDVYYASKPATEVMQILARYLGSASGEQVMIDENDLVYRLEKRAEIRRQIATRKSVQEGKPDRIADLLEEAATEIKRLREANPRKEYL